LRSPAARSERTSRSFGHLGGGENLFPKVSSCIWQLPLAFLVSRC
jgi:hypothetical protein